MADNPNNKGSNWVALVAAPVILALVAGGTAPWWWEAVFDEKNTSSSVDSNSTAPERTEGTNLPTGKDDKGIIPINWNDSPVRLGISQSKGESFVFSCESGNASDRLYGTSTYTGDSSICEAAVHSGIFIREQGGIVSIGIKGQQQFFTGSQRNSVLSRGYGSYPTSFEVLP